MPRQPVRPTAADLSASSRTPAPIPASEAGKPRSLRSRSLLPEPFPLLLRCCEGCRSASGSRRSSQGYLLSAAPALLLALAAHAVRFDPSIQEHDAKAQYERSRRPVCVLLALLPGLMLARSFYNLGSLANDPLLILPIFLVTTLVFAWLATTGRPRNQWIGWSVAWAMQLFLYVSFFPASLSPTHRTTDPDLGTSRAAQQAIARTLGSQPRRCTASPDYPTTRVSTSKPLFVVV